MTAALLAASPFLLSATAAASVVLAAALLLSRVLQDHRDGTRTREEQQVRSLLLAALMGEPDEAYAARAALSQRHGAAWAVAERQAFSMLPKIRGRSRIALVQVLLDKGAAHRAVARTSAWSAVRRCQGAYELGALGEPSAVPVLLPMLDDRSFLVRRTAVRALGAIGDVRAVTPLLQVTGEEPRLTHDLVTALDQIGIPAAPALREELQRGLVQRGGGGRHAELAAAGLGVVGDLHGVPLLARALAEGRPTLRAAAARALGHLGSPAAMPVLMDALDAEATEVRLAAASALGDLAADQACGPLSAWVEASDHELSRRAAASMLRLPSGADRLRASSSPYAREALALAAAGSRRSP